MESLWIDFCKSQDLDQYSSVVQTEILEPWWMFVIKNYTEPLPDVVKSPWEVD